MKRIFVLLFIVFWIANIGWTAKASTTAPNSITMSGIIIDNLSASAHKADLANYIHKYTKVNALMPNCQSSGYSIYTSDGKLLAFTKTSTNKIIKHLKGRTNTLSVEITAKNTSTGMDLVLIKSKKD